MSIPHIMSRIISQPLMIQPQKLETILGVISHKMAGQPQAAVSTSSRREQQFHMVGGIAVIPVVGTLVQRTGGCDALSGLCSYDSLREQIDAALRAPDVDGILLDIDSCGGEVSGCFDLVDHIYASRSVKPIWAFANEYAASAAYAIASAAEKLFVTRTAYVGSIGVVMTHVDQSVLDADMGVKYTMIHRGARKIDFNPHIPLSGEAQSRAQQSVDSVYQIFIETVARNRGIAAEAAAATEADVFMGEQAVSLGLADEVKTFAEIASAMQSSVQRPVSTYAATERTMHKDATSPAAAEPSAAPVTATTESQDSVTKTEAAAQVAAALKADRERVNQISATAAKLGVPQEAIASAISTGASLDAAKAQMTDYLAETSETRTIQSAILNTDNAIDENAPIEEQASAEWKKDAALRKEFTSEASYVAFRKADAAGRARIKNSN